MLFKKALNNVENNGNFDVSYLIINNTLKSCLNITD